jgi:predicted dehydrogenase
MSTKLGIIGTGNMAHLQAKDFAAIEGVELESCYDVIGERARAFAELHACRSVARDVHELIEHCDAVSVITPDAFHHEAALLVLAARKHLLCEKPLTVTLEQAREVARAYQRVRRDGVVGMINFRYRRSAALQRAIGMVEAGEIGEVRLAQGAYWQGWVAAPIWGHWSEERWLWRLQSAAGSGGVLGDIGCHVLDWATAVAGDPRRVRCWLSTFPKIDRDGQARTEYDGKPLDANDTAVIELELESGATMVLQASRWASGIRESRTLQVHGTKGGLRLTLNRPGDRSLEYSVGDGPSQARWETVELEETPNVPERFISAIQTGAFEQPDLLRGAQIQALLHACVLSAETGTWQTVPAWE